MQSSHLAAVGGAVADQNASGGGAPRLTEGSYRFPRAMLKVWGASPLLRTNPALLPRYHTYCLTPRRRALSFEFLGPFYFFIIPVRPIDRGRPNADRAQLDSATAASCATRFRAFASMIHPSMARGKGAFRTYYSLAFRLHDILT